MAFDTKSHSPTSPDGAFRASIGQGKPEPFLLHYTLGSPIVPRCHRLRLCPIPICPIPIAKKTAQPEPRQRRAVEIAA